MHISEGVLSGGALLTGWACSGVGIAVGLKKTEPEKIVRTALISSAFFLASLVNVKVGASSTHLAFLAPMGLALGWGIFPAVFTALILQAFLLQFGGLLVLGANTFIMSSAGLAAYLLFGKIISRAKNRVMIFTFAFIAGAFAVIFGAFLVGVFLTMSERNFLTTAKIILLAHIPLAIIEGVVTGFMITWLRKISPEFLEIS